ncbi:MAG: dienelactone hydrolase family protein [Alphaproteobacteria bacterium]
MRYGTRPGDMPSAPSGGRAIGSLLVAALLFAAVPATAAPVADLADGRTGAIEFMSRTPSAPTPLMTGQAPQTPIAGTLTLPAGAGGRVPAMVISHGSGGIIASRELAWAGRLNRMGVATFVVDSFGPRGIRSTGDDQSQLSTAASTADALYALDLLATHPRIDPARIGVMGFSKGGQVALYTALEPFRRAVAGPDRRFALHVALYASCSIPYLSQTVSPAPIVMLLGGADNYTPADHCARYAEWFRARGAPVSVTVFPGAHHGFDVPDAPRDLPRAQTARGCGLDIMLEPAVSARRWDGTPVAADAIGGYLRGCMQRGATFGGNAAALEGAVAAVGEAVRRHLLR